MKLLETPLPGVMVIEPRVHRDPRGFFLESFHAGKFVALGLPGEFVQLNHSASRGGTLRGLHLQTIEPQGKLVRCIEGEIFDVAVDVRRGSPSFGQWHGEMLSAETFRQLWIPPGFAHGFVATSGQAQIEYLCTTPYRAAGDLSIRWNDPELAIRWPVDSPLLSPRDRDAPLLADVLERLPGYSP